MTSIAPSPVAIRMFNPGIHPRHRIESGNREEQHHHHAAWAGDGVLQSLQSGRVSAEISMFQEFGS